FGAKAGMFPFHIWLPKEGPAAPAPVSALISGIITKTCVFGIIVVSTRLFFEDRVWGTMLSVFAAFTMFLGALLALFSINLKRTLACSSVSQIGFILTGISMIVLLGEENALASMGTILHMINHSMIKLLLFSCAGAIYMKRHSLDLNALRGYGRNKPYLMILFLIGATSIASIPGTSGYISKTLLHEAVVEYIEHAHHLGYSTVWFSAYEWIFLISGGLTFCYMTKLFICLFIEKNPDPVIEEKYEKKGPYMTKLTAACLTAPAVVLVIMGAFPHQVMDKLAEMARPFLFGAELEHTIHYFSLTNLKGSAISISIGLVLYLTLVRFVFMREVKFKARLTADDQHDEHGAEHGSEHAEGAEHADGAAQSVEVDAKIYVNLWPEIIDLEDQLFRIIIKDALQPGIFAAIDAIPEKLVSLLARTAEASEDAK
ncbi:MAG: sodium:proton antiporter, partial [Firmicutes bacterium]|nr:sodium:proton antiporter [Bacillota bacterium]